MRAILVALAAWPLIASAQPKRVPPPEVMEEEEITKSPQIAELAKRVKAGDKSAVAEFWKSAKKKGTPLVEPLADLPHYVLVTIVYRSDTAKNVVVLVPSASD